MPRSLTPAPNKNLAYSDLYRIDFRFVNSVVDHDLAHFGAELLKGGASPLRPARFPVYASSISFDTSFDSRLLSYINATLGTGEWLTLFSLH